MTARRADKIKALEEKIKNAGGKALAVKCDVRKSADVKRPDLSCLNPS